MENRQARGYQAFARVKPGVPLERAQADLATVAERLKKEYPDAYPQGRRSHGDARARCARRWCATARPTLLVLLGTVALVLLIACANVANLTLARLSDRGRELGVRAALGRGAARLLRQLLTESTLLALARAARSGLAGRVPDPRRPRAVRRPLHAARGRGADRRGGARLLARRDRASPASSWARCPGCPHSSGSPALSAGDGRTTAGRSRQRLALRPRRLAARALLHAADRRRAHAAQLREAAAGGRGLPRRQRPHHDGGPQLVEVHDARAPRRTASAC